MDKFTDEELFILYQFVQRDFMRNRIHCEKCPDASYTEICKRCGLKRKNVLLKNIRNKLVSRLWSE